MLDQSSVKATDTTGGLPRSVQVWKVSETSSGMHTPDLRTYTNRLQKIADTDSRRPTGICRPQIKYTHRPTMDVSSTKPEISMPSHLEYCECQHLHSLAHEQMRTVVCDPSLVSHGAARSPRIAMARIDARAHTPQTAVRM